ncbi:MAG: F0F1 ATP synthase subunit A [Roseivirga sp.]
MIFCKLLCGRGRNPIRTYTLLFALLFSSQAQAKDTAKDSDFIIHHIKDAHEWHFATVGHTHITLPLPIIIYSQDRGLEAFSSAHLADAHHHRVPYKGYQLDHDEKIVPLDPNRVVYDLSITKNVAAMLISVVILSGVALAASRRYERHPQAVPQGFWALLELLICFVRDDIAIPNIGKKKYVQFMPYLLSVFFFIWLNNLLGMLPGAANVTGNVSIALVLALFTFVITNINGNKDYWGHVFNPPGVPWWLTPIMIPIELIGLLTKPFSLMVRLFANITAGHIILLSIVGLIFILKNAWIGAVSVPFGAFMFLLKLLVAFLQAYIFTLLSAIYLRAAVESH